MKKTRVVAAMSGGVDSCAAASILMKQGYDVVGVTMKLHECSSAGDSPSCCGIDGISRARDAAMRMGIRHYVIDCVDEFEKQVLKPSWEDYSGGRTPSPCLLCNERIKFGLLFGFAENMGAQYLATGHYSRIETDENGTAVLLRGIDGNKDQSYFLSGLTQNQLKKIIFPLGDMVKSQTREYVRENGLPGYESKESQDACLVGGFSSFADMLQHRFDGSVEAGKIVDEKGKILADHNGVHRFTIGQRKGLGLNTYKTYWVKSINPENSTVIVTDSRDSLMCDNFTVKGLSMENVQKSVIINCQIQTRYRQYPVAASAKFTGETTAEVTTYEPISAVTPGQAAVFYDGEKVLGRGWIDPTLILRR